MCDFLKGAASDEMMLTKKKSSRLFSCCGSFAGPASGVFLQHEIWFCGSSVEVGQCRAVSIHFLFLFFFKQYDIDRISKLHISLRLLLTFFLEYHVISKYVPLCSRLLIMMREVVGLLSVRKV